MSSGGVRCVRAASTCARLSSIAVNLPTLRGLAIATRALRGGGTSTVSTDTLRNIASLPPHRSALHLQPLQAPPAQRRIAIPRPKRKMPPGKLLRLHALSCRTPSSFASLFRSLFLRFFPWAVYTSLKAKRLYQICATVGRNWVTVESFYSRSTSDLKNPSLHILME